MQEDYVVKLDFVLCLRIERKRHDASLRKSDLPSPLLAGGCGDHDGWRPVDVIEREACAYKRQLPRGPFFVGLLVCFDSRDCLGEVRLCALEFQAAGVALVLKQSLLQGLFDSALQLRIDCGAYRVGIACDIADARHRSCFARDFVYEMKA